jgi:hypothetical protein
MKELIDGVLEENIEPGLSSKVKRGCSEYPMLTILGAPLAFH